MRYALRAIICCAQSLNPAVSVSDKATALCIISTRCGQIKLPDPGNLQAGTIMNANEKFTAVKARVDAASIAPLPNSRKIYVEGSRPDIRVPMREITQSDTPESMGFEHNPPIFVYDCSGPYTDLAARIDVRSGLPALRQAWIEERGDTEQLADLSSEFGRMRAADKSLDELRFPDLHRHPRRAKAGANLSGNVTQMHYARQGIITPEMEYIAIRENL